VYRGRADSDVTDDGLRGKVESLETEVVTLRAKLRWFEQSYGEIPANSMAEIQHSLTLGTPIKKRKSVFKEELDGVTHHASENSFAETSILPKEVKDLKGFDRPRVDSIVEVAETSSFTHDTNMDFIAPEQTVRLLQPSPSNKSVASPSPPRRFMQSPPSPTRPPPSPPYTRASPISSPSRDEKSINLLETLSPIHPNIIPAMMPRMNVDASKENMPNKQYEDV
jgi:hypothetical protein